METLASSASAWGLLGLLVAWVAVGPWVLAAVAVAPIRYTGQAEVQRDIANFKAALAKVATIATVTRRERFFMGVPSLRGDRAATVRPVQAVPKHLSYLLATRL